MNIQEIVVAITGITLKIVRVFLTEVKQYLKLSEGIPDTNLTNIWCHVVPCIFHIFQYWDKCIKLIYILDQPSEINDLCFNSSKIMSMYTVKHS